MTVAILGAGVMGETLLSGLLRSGRAVDSLVISERRPARAAELKAKYHVQVLDNAAAGARMRVYVPYGDEWYGYFMRRLAERPANLTFFLRAMATRG